MASGKWGGCMMGLGSGVGVISVGVISTSTGSSLGHTWEEGSSLGIQPSTEGGQLWGWLEESELDGDHMMRGEGLVPGDGSDGKSTLL